MAIEKRYFKEFPDLLITKEQAELLDRYWVEERVNNKVKKAGKYLEGTLWGGNIFLMIMKTLMI